MLITILIFCLGSYALSSVPFGFLLTKLFFKKDIRLYGSGNIGATNVFRQSKILGVLTFLLDSSKTVIIPLIGKYGMEFDKYIIDLILLSSVLGHVYSIFLNFKGGKGFASTLTSFLIVDYRIFILCLGSWIVTIAIFKITGFASIISLIMSSIFAISMRIYHNIKFYDFIYIIIVTSLVVYKHKSNILDIIKRFEFKNIH